jgi:Dyp-type peroxidase family
MNKAHTPAARSVELDDIQGLLRFGHGQLTKSRFLLLQVADPASARRWLLQAPVTTAQVQNPKPKVALHLAFSANGLSALGLQDHIIEGFSEEFVSGISGDENRSRRLGDTGINAPLQWQWGGPGKSVPHMLLLLYSVSGGMEAASKTILDDSFNAGFSVIEELPTGNLATREPFGFVDGISQPRIDWAQARSTDIHEHDHYSNWTALGETILGYRNEYGLYTPRPLIDPTLDRRAITLPNAEDQPAMKDFARNGSYLVVRQLRQDVEGFWRHIDNQAGANARQREQLAARMVGRKRDGTPLAPRSPRSIPGIDPGDSANHFSYDLDRDGELCPIGSHVRRSNPRTGDYPPDVDGFWSRMLRLLGFCQRRDDEDLVASSRFHRLLRRGRAYGPMLSPARALKPSAKQAERGLEFICLVGNISRQFEFVQNAWNMRSKFAGLHNERDPVIGIRDPLNDGTATDHFGSPQASGMTREYRKLPEFVTVVGGGYFFMPGISALRYLASAEAPEE